MRKPYQLPGLTKIHPTMVARSGLELTTSRLHSLTHPPWSRSHEGGYVDNVNYSYRFPVVTACFRYVSDRCEACAEWATPGPLRTASPVAPVAPVALSFGQLSLLSGLLSCADVALLSAAIPLPPAATPSSPPAAPSPSVAQWCFTLITALCDATGEEFHSFKLLVQWFRRVRATSLDVPPAAAVAPTTLRLVWTHLDSPVEGVNECALEAFQLLLESDATPRDGVRENGDGSARSQRTLPGAVLGKVLQLPWHVKGKHSLLAALLRYISVSQVGTDYRACSTSP